MRNPRVIKSLSQYFCRTRLELKVPEGSIYGFTGENGSGKFTTEKLISGLLVPNSGEIRLYGRHFTDAGLILQNTGCALSARIWIISHPPSMI